MNLYEVAIEHAPYQYHRIKVHAVDEVGAQKQAWEIAERMYFRSCLLTVKLLKEHTTN